MALFAEAMLRESPTPLFRFFSRRRSAENALLQNEHLSTWNIKEGRGLPTAEIEQSIATFQRHDNFKVFNFASCTPNEGVTTISACLSVQMPRYSGNNKILLVDANFIHGDIHRIFNKSPEPGLVQFLNGERTADEVIHSLAEPAIDIIACGKANTSSPLKISRPRLKEKMEELADRYECIIIDSSPILPNPESLAVAAVADATFLIIQSKKNHAKVVQKTKSLLERNCCRIGGIVLNRVEHVIPDWLYSAL